MRLCPNLWVTVSDMAFKNQQLVLRGSVENQKTERKLLNDFGGVAVVSPGVMGVAPPLCDDLIPPCCL